MCLSQLRGGDNFLVGSVRAAEADIVHHGTAEQVGILEDDADLLAQAVQLYVAHVDTIDTHGAAGYIPEAG